MIYIWYYEQELVKHTQINSYMVSLIPVLMYHISVFHQLHFMHAYYFIVFFIFQGGWLHFPQNVGLDVIKRIQCCSWIDGWVNNREAGDLRRHRARYDASVMITSTHDNDPTSTQFTVLWYDMIKYQLIVPWRMELWFQICTSRMRWSDYCHGFSRE